jgi:membrane associated rhomboid family serine protease
MKLIILSIRLVLILFTIGIVLALIASPAIYSVGMTIFGVGVIATIWWVTVHLDKKKLPIYYLPKVVVVSGYLLAFVSLFSIFSFYYELQVQVTFTQAIGGFVGGLLIVSIGKNPEILNKRR